MKKLLMILAIIFVVSCSKDDGETCRKINSVTGQKNADGVMVYRIGFYEGESIVSNKSTADYYKTRLGECYDGAK